MKWNSDDNGYRSNEERIIELYSHYTKAGVFKGYYNKKTFAETIFYSSRSSMHACSFLSN